MTIETDVLIIGGGATGVGVARDAAMRGLGVVLVERSGLAEGTTGRYHGLLHSGGRYVVQDPRAAAECVAENRILRRIAAGCIEESGGLFVTTPWDDVGYADRFLAGCGSCGVPVEEISAGDARRREPRLNPDISRAFVVPDAAMDAQKLVSANARSAIAHGGKVLTQHRVTSIVRRGDEIRGAVLVNELTNEVSSIAASVTVNAGGAWAGQVAVMGGIENVEIVPNRGVMIATDRRLARAVVNRCGMPGDGDILVPLRGSSVMGTTHAPADSPDDVHVSDAEVEQLLDQGERLVPGFRRCHMIRVWAGVRPLLRDVKPHNGQGSREITRAHALLDHRRRDGVDGFVTITSGKATTYRLMAEDAVDLVCLRLGLYRPCRTALESLPGL